jgi:NADH:ubiquinone oxidoreductase subunit C
MLKPLNYTLKPGRRCPPLGGGLGLAPSATSGGGVKDADKRYKPWSSSKKCAPTFGRGPVSRDDAGTSPLPPSAGGVAARSAAGVAPAKGGGGWYQVVAGPSLVAATPQVARNALRPLPRPPSGGGTRGDQKETWLSSLKGMLPLWIQNVLVQHNEVTLCCSCKHLYQLVFFLCFHTNALYKSVPDLTAIDYPEYKQRFEVVYLLLSPVYCNRIRIKTLIDEITPLPTLVGVFDGVCWMERETWDMFGVYFYRHPDLRRILTDYGFDGFPLLKNYPLSGYMEVRYDDELKRVVNEPLEITQEFRNFDIISPWVSRSHIED